MIHPALLLCAMLEVAGGCAGASSWGRLQIFERDGDKPKRCGSQLALAVKLCKLSATPTFNFASKPTSQFLFQHLGLVSGHLVNVKESSGLLAAVECAQIAAPCNASRSSVDDPGVLP